MLKYFEVKNYKNFKEPIVFDFGKTGGYKFNQECVANGVVAKCILYGRNSTGKTNLGNALVDIYTILRGVYTNRRTRILNADSEETSACFKYIFEFDDNEIFYEYHRSFNNDLVYEKIVIDDHVVYELDYPSWKFLRLDLARVGAESIQVDNYLGLLEQQEEDEEVVRVPFLRYLISNSAFMPDSALRKMEDFIVRMRMITVGSHMRLFSIGGKGPNNSFIDYLASIQGAKEDFEVFLNSMGVDCRLEIQRLPDGNNQLYFKHEIPIPFYETASSGTLALANIYMRFIFSNKNMSFLFLDEFDAFFHYEMADKIVELFKDKYPNSQIVLTTHNTNLMSNQIMRPDCLFILSRNGKLTAICDATERELREGHNLEKLYIGGEFEKYE